MIDSIGSRIARLREKSGMTQTVLAQRLGITRASVQSWECGENMPSTERLISIADLFHVSTDYLLDIHADKTLCLNDYSSDEQELVFRFLQYCDESAQALDEKK
ncbi:MAG: helix-turn-helix transcriptional regulator [bacterium]|nr:helix-turn-helix transcriptional regulator [bacterium]MDY4100330.1 helix-turn-helix transcriptional regulator [Lachnospiraceae bacterium]